MITDKLHETTIPQQGGETVSISGKTGTLSFLVAVLLVVASSANALHDSIPTNPYRTVQIFKNQCEIAVPNEFRKIKSKKADHPHPYLATARFGYHYRKETTLKFYCTTENYPAEKYGAEIWAVMEKLTAHVKKKIFLESGYVVVNREKKSHRKTKNLYYIKYACLTPKEVPYYMLGLCVEHNGKMLIGFVTSPQKGFIDAYEKVLYESLQLKNTN